MLSLGFMLSLSGMITLGTSYLVRIFISHLGGLTDVGLYSAGFAIINSYVGMIFTAMSTDYYPRLSGVAHNNVLARKEVNQQSEIAILILAPILCVFLVYVNGVVILLYSPKFISIRSMIHWAAFGIFFKAAGWAIAFLLLAKGASLVFFWSELLVNTYLLCFNLIGYYYWGLTGLGFSFLITYVIYLIQIIIITWRYYRFRFKIVFIRLFIIELSIGFLCLLVVKLTNGMLTYILGSILVIISCAYSLYEIDKRIELKGVLSSMKKFI
jgi:O-antigen/teichoic acid export membrane protein